jgi:hypothetical protein
MKRRKFVESLLALPALQTAASAQQANPPAQSNTPARVLPQQPQEVPKLAVVQVDLVSETDQRFFSSDQFAALEKLGATLMPPLKGNPGALDADAPDFLDFLISVSPEDRQKLYRDGLDGLNQQAKKQFDKRFSDLDSSQVDAILQPLLVARAWPLDFPSDPMKNFLAQVHDDLRTATENSKEWADSAHKSQRRERGFNRSVGYYWRPIDPVIRG